MMSIPSSHSKKIVRPYRPKKNHNCADRPAMRYFVHVPKALIWILRATTGDLSKFRNRKRLHSDFLNVVHNSCETFSECVRLYMEIPSFLFSALDSFLVAKDEQLGLLADKPKEYFLSANKLFGRMLYAKIFELVKEDNNLCDRFSPCNVGDLLGFLHGWELKNDEKEGDGEVVKDSMEPGPSENETKLAENHGELRVAFMCEDELPPSGTQCIDVLRTSIAEIAAKRATD